MHVKENWFGFQYFWPMIRVAICDDDREFCSELKKTLREGLIPRERFLIDMFYSGEQLLYACLTEQRSYDIILLDIEMPVMDGLEAGRRIRELDKNTEIIILTNYEKYALSSYEMHPYNYLLKPLDNEKLLEMCHKIVEEKMILTAGYLDIEVPGGFIHAPYSEILFFESDKQKAHIHLRCRVISVYKKLSDILPLLDGRFAQSHKSFIVNLEYIEDIDKGYTNITLFGCDELIPISRRMKATFLKSLKEYIYEHRHI